MKKIFSIFLNILAYSVLVVVVSAQENPKQPERNWLADYKLYSDIHLFHRYDRYSTIDILNFREKLDRIGQSNSIGEWEGTFAPGGEVTVSYSLMKIDFDVGFVSFYLYTCLPELRFLDYGSATDDFDTVEVLSEVPTGSPRKQRRQTFVKVKWGKNNYLVDEDSLEIFAAKAVGVFIEPENADDPNYHRWSNHWINGDPEYVPTGLPLYPSRFKHVEKKPIRAKVLKIISRTVDKELELGNHYYSAENAIYKLLIGVGSNQSVKKGMVFQLMPSSEDIVITNVSPSVSIGILVRPIDEKKRDHCLDDDSNKINCSKIARYMPVSTKIGYFWY